MKTIPLKSGYLLFFFLLSFLANYPSAYAGAESVNPNGQSARQQEKLPRSNKSRKFQKKKKTKSIKKGAASTGKIFALIFFISLGLILSIAFMGLALATMAGGAAIVIVNIVGIFSVLASIGYLVGGVGALVVMADSKKTGEPTEPIVKAAGITFIVLTALWILSFIIFLAIALRGGII